MKTKWINLGLVILLGASLLAVVHGCGKENEASFVTIEGAVE